jgi:hypothetical protein
MTLHDRIEAAVRARLNVAQKAAERWPGPWSQRSELGWGPVPDFVARNDPDQIIRDCTEDLWLLSPHQPHPNDVRNGFDPECTCGHWQQRTCPNVESLMRRYGITEVSDGD